MNHPDATELHDLLAGGLYIALLLLVGYAVLCSILKPIRRSWSELLGFSFAAGGGVVSLVLFYVSMAGAIPNRITLACIAAVSIAILMLISRQKGLLLPVVEKTKNKPGLSTILGGFAVAVILITACGVSAKAGWSVMENIDAFAIWLFKAKCIAAMPLIPIPQEFLNPSLSFSHQDYPLGFPFLVSGLFTAIGRFDDTWIRIILMPIYLALILVVYSAIRKYHRRPIALVITAIFVTAPTLALNAGCAIPETFLLLAYVCTLSLMLRWMDTGDRGDLILSMLFAAIAAFTKNEGLALLPVFAIAALGWATVIRNRGRWIDCAAAFTVALAIIMPWLIYRAYLPKTHEDYGGKLTSAALILHNLSRLGYVLPAYFSLMFDKGHVGSKQTGYVGPIWYLLALFAILGFRGFRRGPVVLLWFILLIQLGLFLGAFIVTPWNVEDLLPMVTTRLLTQASPMATLLIALHLRELPIGQKSIQITGNS